MDSQQQFAVSPSIDNPSAPSPKPENVTQPTHTTQEAQPPGRGRRVTDGPLAQLTPGERQDTLEAGRGVFEAEALALLELSKTLDEDFVDVVRMILDCPGRVVVMGVGKSGIVGKKIAATLASTGTPAFFVHATEAFHGDLGMLRRMDLALLISQSGTTSETVSLLEPLRRIGTTIVAMTGNQTSRLAMAADGLLLTPVAREACPNNLAPTTSTTVAMAMGDALAVALIKARKFTAEHFAGFHPGGALGRRMAKVSEYMRTHDLPICESRTTLINALSRMTDSRLGMVVVVGGDKILGVLTDGDVRRALERDQAEGHETLWKSVDSLMNRSPIVISPDASLSTAQEALRRHKVKTLLVSGDGSRLAGVLDLYTI
jgi:arabinose-5-phosphate isomerase